ncbi:efflux RND transporter periplasmic adaptor subunit [Enhygromyxa salina]|uniref:efflux RND transporter periplasmic adaptor subunit n=1 Tax=Enhygromyxa salina TaxID=215803 RepID=UPI0015E60333|nr:efflux RND transporter periplasmic adaptor subunit [Enhygromyxa salina]
MLGPPACGDPLADAAPPAVDSAVDRRPDPAPLAAGHVAVVVPARAVDVAPTVTGELVSLRVWPGDSCRAGEPLAQLDDSAARNEIAVVEAELRQQRAALRHARVDAQQSQAQAGELDELAAAGHTSTRERDDARFEARRREADLDAAVAAVAESRAQLDRLHRELQDSTIVAPFDGVVARRYLDEGAVTGPGSPVLRLIAGSTPWVRFAVEPSELEALALGTELRVRLEHGVELPARVEHVAPEVDPASEMVFVDAALVLAGPDDELGFELAIGTPALVFTGRASDADARATP